MTMNELIGAVSELRRGGEVRLLTGMGSCRCGDTDGVLTIRDGRVYSRCRGNESWQNYEGPAADCTVGYGMGEIARAVARAVEHGIFQAVDCQSAVEKYHETPEIAAAAWRPFLLAAYAAGINPLPEIRRGLEITLHYSSGKVVFGATEIAAGEKTPERWFTAAGSRWTGGISVSVINQ